MTKSKSTPEGSLTGVVKRVAFADGFFRILEVMVLTTDLPWSQPMITVIGPVGTVREGQVYRFVGYLTTNRRYGAQMVARFSEAVVN